MRAVNLLPKDDARRGKGKPNPAVLVGASGAVLVAAVLATGFLLESAKVTDRRNTLDGLRTELAVTPPPVAPSATETGLAEEKRQRVVALSAALSQRIAWDRVLREFSLVLPSDVWLTGLSARSPLSAATPSGLGVPAVGKAPTGFTINGYTYSQESVARLLARLAVVPDLTNVALQKSVLATVAGRSIVQFTIVADIRAPGAVS